MAFHSPSPATQSLTRPGGRRRGPGPARQRDRSQCMMLRHGTYGLQAIRRTALVAIQLLLHTGQSVMGAGGAYDTVEEGAMNKARPLRQGPDSQRAAPGPASPPTPHPTSSLLICTTLAPPFPFHPPCSHQKRNNRPLVTSQENEPCAKTLLQVRHRGIRCTIRASHAPPIIASAPIAQATCQPPHSENGSIKNKSRARRI